MSNLLKFGSYEAEAAKEEAEEIAKLGGQFHKLHVGRNQLRVLPPPLGKRSPFTIVFQHYVNVMGKATTVNCPRMMAKRTCMVCRTAEQLLATGNPQDEQTAKDIQAKVRVYANVIDRENPENGPLTLGFGKGIHEDLKTLREDPDSGGDFTHPESGYDIIILRTGTGVNTEYKVQGSRKQSPLAPDAALMQEWIDGQPNHTRLMNVPTEQDIMKAVGTALMGLGGRPVPQQPAPGAKKARTAEDDALEVDGSVE